MNRPIEEDLRIVQSEIEKALSGFVGWTSAPSTISMVNSRIKSVLLDLMVRKILPVPHTPMVDVNHFKEIAHLNGKIRVLNERLCEIDDSDYDKWRETNNEIARTVLARDALESQVRDKHSMTVFLKNEDFTPFDWAEFYE